MYKPEAPRSPDPVSVTEARQTFADLVNRVAYGNERITVVRHGRAVAAIVPMSDVHRLEAIDAGATTGERPSTSPMAQPAPRCTDTGPRA
jgi:prevent-host-death family protein